MEHGYQENKVAERPQVEKCMRNRNKLAKGVNW